MVARNARIPLLPSVGILAVAACVVAGGIRPAVGQAIQEAVSLQLIHRVQALGEAPYEDDPPPAGTEVAVIPVEGARSRTLPNLTSVTRDSLVRRASTVSLQSLSARGTTPTRYPTTGASERIYYVLAETPDGALYESYVNTGTLSSPRFVPGADAVQSGRMTIGPVPPDARATMQAVFEAASVADASRKEKAPDSARDRPDAGGAEAEPARDTATGRTASSSAGSSSGNRPQKATTQHTSMGAGIQRQATPRENLPQPPQRRTATEGGGLDTWSLVLGGIVGLLFGLGIGWLIQRERLRAAEEDRDYWQSRFREEQARAYRQATGIQLGQDAEVEAESPSPSEYADTQDIDELRQANAELHAENEELKDRLREVRESVQRLRDEHDEDDPEGA